MNYKKSLIIFVAAMMGMMDIAVSQNRTYSVNGDFIFWNKTILKNDFINLLENLDKTNPNTQETINQLVRKPNKQLFH